MPVLVFGGAASMALISLATSAAEAESLPWSVLSAVSVASFLGGQIALLILTIVGWGIRRRRETMTRLLLATIVVGVVSLIVTLAATGY